MTRRLQRGNERTRPEEKKKRIGATYIAGTGVAAGVTALVLLHNPSTEGPMECPDLECPKPALSARPIGGSSDSRPVRRDGHCEMDKAEHDEASPDFDPESCGFCGDLQRQPWESQEICPIDFHCGNGEREQGTLFAAIVPVETPDGVVYAHAIVKLSESCNEKADNYCEADCPTKSSVSRRGGGRRKEKATTTTTPKTTSKIGQCASPPNTTTASGVMREARAKARERSPRIRKKLTEDTSDSVRVRITFLVDERGRTKFSGATATCSGTCDHGTSANIKVELGELGLDGKQVATPGNACKWTFPASAPSGR